MVLTKTMVLPAELMPEALQRLDVSTGNAQKELDMRMLAKWGSIDGG